MQKNGQIDRSKRGVGSDILVKNEILNQNLSHLPIPLTQ